MKNMAKCHYKWLNYNDSDNKNNKNKSNVSAIKTIAITRVLLN